MTTTEFIYDYDDELKRKWDAELRSQGKHNGPCQFATASRSSQQMARSQPTEKERLVSNIQSLIASRMEEHPEEFDSGDDPVSRLSRLLRAAELRIKIEQQELFSPRNMERIRREIALEKNVKLLQDLPKMMFAADSY